MPTEGSYSVECNRRYGIKNDAPLSTTVAPALRAAVVLNPPCISSQHTIKTHTYNIECTECISLECGRAAGNPHRTYAYSSEPGFKPTTLLPHCVAHLEWGNCQTSLSLCILAAALIISSDRLSWRNALFWKIIIYSSFTESPTPAILVEVFLNVLLFWL